jgi:hypothetical protein
VLARAEVKNMKIELVVGERATPGALKFAGGWVDGLDTLDLVFLLTERGLSRRTREAIKAELRARLAKRGRKRLNGELPDGPR